MNYELEPENRETPMQRRLNKVLNVIYALAAVAFAIFAALSVSCRQP